VSNIAIKVENLSKSYLLGHQSAALGSETTLRDNVVAATRGLVRKTRNLVQGGGLLAGSATEEFWALSDVSFEIRRGEVIGIIGRNGAGKSTLLKILSRITEPTRGRITLKGRVSSLLEVGTGFHPELSGRENIYLNGAILGMSRREIAAKFDEIVAFAEVERFLDTPVKRYSSGMYVRLAFAVAAHLEPEILIVDEVLAVGDLEFQKKCLGKMSEFSLTGRTVMFVSHDLNAVLRLCPTSILLKSGQMLAMGPSASVVEGYKKQGRNEIQRRRFGSDDFTVELEQAVVDIQDEHVVLNYGVRIQSSTTHKSMYFAFDVVDPFGTAIGQAFSVDLGPDTIAAGKSERRRFRIFLPRLIPGEYSVAFWTGPHNTTTIFLEEDFHRFDILESPSKNRTIPHTRDHGSFVPKMELSHDD